MKKVVYLSGGVGGAKFAKGLSKLKNIDLSIIFLNHFSYQNSYHQPS